jgi:3-methylcrotonyl-CoA carboxylase alpha subunit
MQISCSLTSTAFFYRFQATQLRGESAAGSAALEIRSEIPGRIIKVLVKPGDQVRQGQGVIVQEAMKMEITLVAGSDRRVAEVLVEPGAQVAADEVLIRLADKNET